MAPRSSTPKNTSTPNAADASAASEPAAPKKAATPKVLSLIEDDVPKAKSAPRSANPLTPLGAKPAKASKNGREDDGMTSVDLRLLRSFVVLAQQLSFTRAAVELNMSQPTLTQQIRKLEAELGFALFTRSTRQIFLTAQGCELLPRAERLVADGESIGRMVRELRKRGAPRTGPGDRGNSGVYGLSDREYRAQRAAPASLRQSAHQWRAHHATARNSEHLHFAVHG